MSHTRRQFTLRGLPEGIFHELEREARQKGTSLNKLLLRKLVPPDQRTTGGCERLLRLAGTWTEAQAREFEQAAQDHRRIDPELWS